MLNNERCGTWRIFDTQPIVIVPAKNDWPPITMRTMRRHESDRLFVVAARAALHAAEMR